MRITSGTAKGFTLRVPSGGNIRPTTDMARKAIFDILGCAVEGSRFLDLFAGTGANGIEALSRGASHVDFVEISETCAKNIRENLTKTQLADKARIIRMDAFRFIEKFRESAQYDIVFADPPYGEDRKNTAGNMAENTLHNISQGNILHKESSLIIEHSARIELPPVSGEMVLWKKRRYGSTAITIYRNG